MPRPYAEAHTAIGKLIRERLIALNRTRADFTTCLGAVLHRNQADGAYGRPIKRENIDRYIRTWFKNTVPRPEHRTAIASALEVDIFTVEAACRGIDQMERQNISSIDIAEEYIDNPKPYATGTHVLNSMFLMCGDYSTPLYLVSKYERLPIIVPKEIEVLYDSLVRRAANRTPLAPFWDGPLVRLAGFDLSQSRPLPNGEEWRILGLTLAPVSWHQYTALNGFLDDPILPGGVTIREKFADRKRLYQSFGDVSWCRLSNILTIAMVPITNDGYGLFVQRSPQGVTAYPNLYTSGVAENIHPILDSARDDGYPIRPYWENTPSYATRPVDDTFSNPSPFLTAQRGLYEEISTEFHKNLAPDQYKFLNLGWSLQTFHPGLIGVIETGLSKDELQELAKRTPGRDTGEHSSTFFVSLEDRQETQSLLDAPEKWIDFGLAGLMTAINYWISSRRGGA